MIRLMRMPKVTSVLHCCLCIVAFALTAVSTAVAQTASPKNVNTPFSFNPTYQAKAENAAIRVIVDRFSGQYTFETKQGDAILFENGTGLTSFTNIRFNNATYTNNNSRFSQPPPFTQRLPTGTVSALPDRVRFETRISAGGKQLTARQDFIPGLDQDFAFITLRTTLKNESALPVSAGLQLMYDLFLAGRDQLDVDVNGAIVQYETQWLGAAIPSTWKATSPIDPLVLLGRFGPLAMDKPDRFTVGRWSYAGYLGGAAWNYAPSGLPFGDDAVLMQWDEHIIAPGDSISISLDYGFNVSITASLACAAQQLSLNAGETGYMPNPFNVFATITNTGMLPIDTLTLRLTLPPKVTLGFAETLVKTSVVPCLPGDSIRFTWTLLADTAAIETTLAFPVDIISPAPLATQCVALSRLPAIPRYEALLQCGDTLRQALSSDGYSYIPTPLPFRVRVINTGTRALDSLSVSLSLPSGTVSLASGTYTQFVTPITLAPGDTGAATWQLVMQPQRQAGAVQVNVACIGQRIPFLLCLQTILYPAVSTPPPCVPAGVTTRGTDYWTAFLPNGSTDAKAFCLIFLPEETTHVRIEKPNDATYPKEFDIPGGVISTSCFDEPTDLEVAEVVQRYGIHITTDKPVTLYCGNASPRHSDASLVLPVEALGKIYSTVGYDFSDSQPYEHFLVLATQDSTTVRVIPFSFTSTGVFPGDTLAESLNTFDTYYVLSGVMGASGGLTGSRVLADKPVVVVTGAASGWIPTNYLDYYGYLNPHFEQALADDFIGVDYVASPFLSRLNGDTYKVVATQDSTTVGIGANPPLLLQNANDSYEFLLGDATHIVSDKPVVLAQFANSALWDDPNNEYGDSSMLILSPTNRFTNCADVPGDFFDLMLGSDSLALRRRGRPLSYVRRKGVDPDTLSLIGAMPAAGSESAFINITAVKGGEALVALDGLLLPDTLFHDVPGSSFTAARLQLQPGLHNVATGDPRGMGVVVYGFTTHDAFSMNGGFQVRKPSPATGVGQTPDAAQPAGFDAGMPYPNPAYEGTAIRIGLSAPADVRLQLFDMLGVCRRSTAFGMYPAGAHILAVSVDGLQPGMYEAVIHAGASVARRTLMVLR